MAMQIVQRLILLFIILLEIPVSTLAVEIPAGWVDDGIYKGENKFKSGLRCYDCLDCDEPFSHEYRDCFSATSCYIFRAKLQLNGYLQWKFYKEHLPKEDYKIWKIDWYQRNLTIRGCADYGFNCPEMMKEQKVEGPFKTPFHMLKSLDCEECATNLCNKKKTQDHPMVDRAAVLGSAAATSIYVNDFINDTLILCGIVKIINALWSA